MAEGSFDAAQQPALEARRLRMELSTLWSLLLVGVQMANVIGLRAAPSPPSQITLDGSLGVKSSLFPNANRQFQITGDLGYKLGPNLFQSFGQFNLSQGYEAVFSGPPDVQNILARVTGGPSAIDGKLTSSIQGANLFLLNSSGITFGPDAVLNVTGAFYASTADYIALSDGKRFEGTGGDSARLSMAPPAAFGFFGKGNGPISVSGSALVNNNGNLGLVGGDVEIQGDGQQGLKKVQAPGNSIVLASMKSAGELAMAPDQVAASATRFSQQGSITIGDKAVIDATPRPGDAGGQVMIRAGRLTVNNAIIRKDSYQADSGWAVDIETTEGITLANGAIVSTEARNLKGKASGLSIRGDNVALNSGSQVSSSTSGAGAGGAIQLLAKTIEINDASIQTQTSGSGTGGSIYLAAAPDGAPAQSISIESSATQSNIRAIAQSTGDAGSITIIASQLELSGPQSTIAGYTLLGSGSGANVALFLDKLTIESGAKLDLRTYGSGSGGQLFVLGTQPSGEWARLEDLKWKSESKRFENIWPERPATAVVVDSGSILSGSEPLNPRVTPGDSGQITVSARSIEVAGANAEISAKALSNRNPPKAGRAGSVVLASQGDLTVRDGAQVLVSSVGGRGGNAQLTAARSLSVLGPGKTVSAEGSPGGNVILGATGGIYLHDPQITARSESDQGGNITIGGLPLKEETPPDFRRTVAPQFVVLNRSTLQANAPVGPGGNIYIQTAPFLKSTDSKIDVTGLQPGIAVVPVQNRSPISTLTELQTEVVKSPDWAQPASWELTDLGGYTVVGSRRETEGRRRIVLEH